MTVIEHHYRWLLIQGLFKLRGSFTLSISLSLYSKSFGKSLNYHECVFRLNYPYQIIFVYSLYPAVLLVCCLCGDEMLADFFMGGASCETDRARNIFWARSKQMCKSPLYIIWEAGKVCLDLALLICESFESL